jgi:hypothetical protein
MRPAEEKNGADGPSEATLAALKYRFWLNFIRTVAKSYVDELPGDKRRNIMVWRLAETMLKAAEVALAGMPPQKCGSFGRTALSTLKDHEDVTETPLSFVEDRDSALKALNRPLVARDNQ